MFFNYSNNTCHEMLRIRTIDLCTRTYIDICIYFVSVTFQYINTVMLDLNFAAITLRDSRLIFTFRILSHNTSISNFLGTV